MEIPTNTTVDTAIEKAVEIIVSKLQESSYATITNNLLNKEQAIKVCDMFFAKGYHHEIRMHMNASCIAFFAQVTISKTFVRSNDARFAWSEYVK